MQNALSFGEDSWPGDLFLDPAVALPPDSCYRLVLHAPHGPGYDSVAYLQLWAWLTNGTVIQIQGHRVGHHYAGYSWIMNNQQKL